MSDSKTFLADTMNQEIRYRISQASEMIMLCCVLK